MKMTHSLASIAVAAASLVITSSALGAHLVQYWPLDQAPGATTAPNLVPGGNTALITNADPSAAWINTGLPPQLTKSTGAIYLYGTNDHINLGIPGVEDSATVSLWLNLGNDFIGDMRLISAMTDNTYFAGLIRLDNLGTGKMQVVSSVSGLWGGGAWNDLGPIMPAGTWAHVALAYSGGTVTLYVNGVNAGTSYGGFRFKTSELGLGAKLKTYGNSFIGGIDDVAIWDGPLSQQSIQQLAAGASPTSIVDVPEPPQPAQLVQYFTFDDGPGSEIATNAIPSGNTGTLTNFDAAAAWTSSGLSPRLTNSTGALVFTGGSFVNLGNINLFGSAAVSMWIKPANCSNDFRIYNQLSGSTYNPGSIKFVGAGGLAVYNSTTDLRVTPDGAIPTNEWTHLVFSYDNGFVTAFVNGVPQITAKAVFAFNTDPFGLGSKFKLSYGKSFVGTIDDVSIWNRALSPTSIQRLAQGVSPLAIVDTVEPLPAPQLSFTTASRSGAKLTQYFPIEEPDGSTNAANLVAGGNMGTLVNYVASSPWTNSGLAGKLTSSSSALVMNGVANYANIGNIGLTAPLSISMWIKPSSAFTNADSVLFGQLSGPNSGVDIHIGSVRLTKGGGLVARGASLDVAPSGTIQPDQWIHLAFVYQDGMKTYVNGTNLVFTSTNGCTFNTDPFGLGAPLWALTAPVYQSFPGQMDDVSIWSGALSPENVQDLANGTTPTAIGGGPVLAQYFPLDGTGTQVTLPNSVAGGNPGELVNYEFNIHSWDSTVVPPGLQGSTRSLYLNGFGEYLKIGNLNQTNSATISLWLRPNTLAGDQRLISQLSGPSTQQGPVGYTQNGQVWVWGSPGSGNAYYYPGPAGCLQAGTWHHLLLTYSGSSATFYLDGVEKGTAASGFHFKGPETGIGAKWISQYGNSVSGYIDDISVWDKPLSMDSIIQLARGVAPNSVVDKPKDMVLSWPGYPGPYYVLQTATNLAGPWTTITPATTLSGSSYTATVPMVEVTPMRFYRMVKP